MSSRTLGLPKVAGSERHRRARIHRDSDNLRALSRAVLYCVSRGTSEIRNRDQMPKSSPYGAKLPVSGAARNKNWADRRGFPPKSVQTLRRETGWRMTESDAKCSPQRTGVYALRRFIDNGVRAPTVYKLPPEFMTSGDENANSQQRFAALRDRRAMATYSHLRRPSSR